MTKQITPQELEQLEEELLNSHQAIITPLSPASGTIRSTDNRLAATYSYDAASGTLSVTLSKHDGMPGFVANMGLSSKLDQAIAAVRANSPK
jgi:hypothetical protein